MRSKLLHCALCAGALFTGCQSNHGGDISSIQFVHKYGFNVSEKEWQERDQDGQIISKLSNGVTISRSFENGQLHGQTTYSYPHCDVIEKVQIYDQGILLKEIINDTAGIPIREDLYEFDNRKITTLWDEQGAPLSIEEFDDEQLAAAKYFSPEHDLEGQIEAGYGTRVKRDRSGTLFYRDNIENGAIVERSCYHPNGQIHSVSRYHDYQLHGEQIKYTASGKPLMTLQWNHGVLHGIKTVYRNGIKISEIPYHNGQKHGVERHFDDLGTLTAEIEWRNDKKHGPSRYHSDETAMEWFYKGQPVTAQKFDLLEKKLIANLTTE